MINELQVGRFNAILKKLLGIKADAPAPVIGAEVIPAIILENDRPEFYILGGGKLGIGGQFVNGGVGVRPIFALQNPVSSGVLIVVEQVVVTSDGTGSSAIPAITDSVGALTNTNLAIHRDVRSRVNAGLNLGITGQLFSGSAAAVPGTGSVIGFWNIIAPGFSNVQMNVVLAPGFVFHVSGTVNTNLGVTIWWRERIIEDSEVRP